jgi:von Willebrand factor type D domain/Effector protein
VRRRGWAHGAGRFAVVIAFSVGVLLLSSESAHAATVSGPQLRVSTAHSSYRPGAAVPLSVTVRNGGSAACSLASVADGSLMVSAATFDGVALIPSYSSAEYLDGADSLVAGQVVSVAPGRSVSFTTVADTPGTLDTHTPVVGGAELVASWPTSAKGAYRFSLAYQVSPLAGDKACLGESNTVTVAFRIGDPGSQRWLIVGVIAAGTLLILLLIVASVWRRRSRRRAPGQVGAVTVVIALAVAMTALMAVRATPADAGVVVDPGSGPTSGGNLGAYDACAGDINKYDPTMLPFFNQPGVNLSIHEAPWGLHTQTLWNSAKSVTINWDPNYRGRLPGDSVNADPCASLYHELAHARDHLNGTLSTTECDDTGINDNEVLATLAENGYREANGLDPRQTYGAHLLPSSMADCTPPTSKLFGWLNGDPHLMTFDGQRYDFQAVGEFTAVSSSTGDLTIQVRQAAFETSRAVAVNSAVAMNVSGTHLGFYLSDGVVVVHRTSVAAEVSVGKTSLPDGATLERIDDPYRGAEYVVTWADGTSASVWRAGVYGLVVTITPSASRAKTLSGLLGNFDGDPSNDLALPGGKVITPTSASLYPSFADSLRVTSATSLFDYAPGTTTATFTDRSFPAAPANTAGLTSAQRAAALSACTAAGVTNVTDRDNCELDVALTGSAAFAISAGDIEQSQLPGGSTSASGNGGGPPISSTGQTTTASVSQPNSVAHVTFNGTRGQRVHVQVVATTLPDQCSALALHGPDDNVLANGCTTPGDAIDGFLLPSNGEYNIFVDPSGGAVGQITLKVSLSQDQVIPATVGGPAVTATIAAPGDQAQVSFTVTAGQKVFVDATNVSLPDQCGALELNGPGNDDLALGCIADKSGYIDGLVLPTSGNYTISINPSGESTGSATITLIADHDQQLQTRVGGPAVTATVTEPGAVSDLTFPGAAGQTINVVGSGSTLPHGCGAISLLAPDQSRLKLFCDDGGTGSLGTVTLPIDGTYALLLDPSDRAVGQIDLMVTTAK